MDFSYMDCTFPCASGGLLMGTNSSSYKISRHLAGKSECAIFNEAQNQVPLLTAQHIPKYSHSLPFLRFTL